MRKLSDQEITRRSKLETFKKDHYDPYSIYKVERSCTLEQFNNRYQQETKEELESKDQTKITLAGRLMAMRSNFATIKDYSGNGQLYIGKDANVTALAIYDAADIGDIVEATGIAMKTKTDAVTLRVTDFKIVSKALRPLPEKFHGLKDEETRSRQRYVDLIMNEGSMQSFVMRSKIISAIRAYMDSIDFLEVETPILQPILGGANAKPFKTHYNALNEEFYLRVATELPLKKLIVGGFERVYEIGRIFRNEGMDSTHNPEFTSLEAYQAYASMEDVMDLVENIIKAAAKSVNKFQFKHRGFDIDLAPSFKRVNMVDIIKQETGIDFLKITNDKDAVELAKKHNVKLEKHQMTYGHIVNAFFEEFGEKACIQPTFVYGHPVDVSPLSKKDYEDQRFTKRFELFIGQKEFANAFSELNDPIDQYERFAEQVAEKEKGNDEAVEMDYDFIGALEIGLPPTGGIGIGIDRLVMLLTENDSIRNVLLFPQLKKESQQ